MLKEVRNAGGSAGGWTRTCDSCHTAPCAIYCKADSAYLCGGCDVRVHAANRLASRHERVWVCEACEGAPAAVTCKADAAALCAACDADIHTANPLARRHHRVPVLPIIGRLYGPQAAGAGEGYEFVAGDVDEVEDDEREDEAASWLVLNPVKNDSNGGNQNYGGEVVDEYLDLVEYNSCGDNQLCGDYGQGQYCESVHQGKNDGSDSVVPVQFGTGNEQQQSFQMDMEFEASKAGFGYPPSLSHSVSISSMEASVVPDATMADISNLHSRPPKGTIDLFSGPPLQIPPQFSPMDREARVLRYREKRKTRKFEKTIRYASRKAYAETRPRIKGRFAKRTDVEVEVDHMFSATVMAESGYGIVPSF